MADGRSKKVEDMKSRDIDAHRKGGDVARDGSFAGADIAGDELSAMVLRACGIARDSVFNVRDFLADNSRMAFLAIKDCEKELDQIERRIDEHLPDAITRVGEAKARQLLACLKFITDLERIGDLSYSAVMQLQSLNLQYMFEFNGKHAHAIRTHFRSQIIARGLGVCEFDTSPRSFFSISPSDS